MIPSKSLNHSRTLRDSVAPLHPLPFFAAFLCRFPHHGAATARSFHYSHFFPAVLLTFAFLAAVFAVAAAHLPARPNTLSM